MLPAASNEEVIDLGGSESNGTDHAYLTCEILQPAEPQPARKREAEENEIVVGGGEVSLKRLKME